MPYNTRRKSLSLSSLGIHVPVTQAARAAAASAAVVHASSAAATASSSGAHTSSDNLQPSHALDAPLSKRIKRWHDKGASGIVIPTGTRAVAATSVPHRVEPRDYDQTPPPSPDVFSSVREVEFISEDDEDAPPRRQGAKRVALHHINDDIVEAVISQLVATGNRPHLIKELAAVLTQRLPIVQHSANPCAIISSRLSTFLKRACWSTSSPCPLGKELETIHPRRTYYFLTTCARQPLPAASESDIQLLPLRVSPSISSEGLPLDHIDVDARSRVSPSPEVDLSSPKLLDDMDENVGTPSTSMSPARDACLLPRERRTRGASPPLEKDEREFTQTADGLQKRKFGADIALADVLDPAPTTPGLDESLFCDARTASYSLGSLAMVVSPSMKASHPTASIRRDIDGESWLKLGGLLDWDQMPENMELEELDCLFESCER